MVITKQDRDKMLHTIHISKAVFILGPKRLGIAFDGFNQLYIMSFQWRQGDAPMLQHAQNLQAIMNSDNG